MCADALPPCRCFTAGVFNGGVYRIGITNEQHRQPLNAVAVHLQKDLLENLGWPAGDSDAIDPGQLRNRMNDVFRTHLRDRQHLIVLDGAPSWDLVEFMKCDDMRGVVLVTSEPNLNSTARVADIMNNAADWANVNVMGVQLVPCALARAKAEELMRRVIVTPQPLPLVKEVRFSSV